MFSRNADRSAPTGVTSTGVRDLSAPPPAPPAPIIDPEATVVARADRVEGTIRVAGGLRVLGSVEGRIEATTIVVEEGGRVDADVVADEVVIAGEYTGKLLCRQRLEVRSSGRVSGQVETFRLMLHEGAAVDGEMKMLKQPGVGDAEANRAGSLLRGGLADAVRAAAPLAPVPGQVPPGAEPIG